MADLCHKCGAHVASPWKFCPQCGAVIATEVHEHTSPPETEKAPVRSTFAGLFFGIVATPVLLIVGSLLCLTGLGAILGIPMIIAAIVAPLAGPLVGFTALKGKCPTCGSPVSSVNSSQSFDCDTCKSRIAIRDHRFVAIA